MPIHTSPTASELRALARALGAEEWEGEDDWIEFEVAGVPVIVELIDQIERYRIEVIFAAGGEGEIQSWIDSQPPPRSGLLQASPDDEGGWVGLLMYERQSGATDWSTDPMVDDVRHYAEAWSKGTRVRTPSVRAPYEIGGDPRTVPPASAWLLKGTEASYPSAEMLRAYRAAAAVGIFDWDWTAAAQTQFGDLVLFYFLAPRKAVHFVARAASSAYFSRDVPVQADHEVSQSQWWALFTAPIEIEPISVAVLREAAHGYLPMRGRSGLYLPPEVVSSLAFRAVNPADQTELDRIVSVPVGLSHLPDPADVTVDVWRDLSAGALPLEQHVSSHLVEPLLRLLLHETGVTWRREYPVGRRWADFVILDGTRPIHVIEVKKVVRSHLSHGWSQSPDFQQLRWYADRLGTGGTLIDSHRLVLLRRGAHKPERELTRRRATAADLEALRRHLLEALADR